MSEQLKSEQSSSPEIGRSPASLVSDEDYRSMFRDPEKVGFFVDALGTELQLEEKGVALPATDQGPN